MRKALLILSYITGSMMIIGLISMVSQYYLDFYEVIGPLAVIAQSIIAIIYCHKNA